jgi:hypothetical protein
LPITNAVAFRAGTPPPSTAAPSTVRWSSGVGTLRFYATVKEIECHPVAPSGTGSRRA